MGTTETTSDAVVQVVELGAPPWPTVDPFLFCVHHNDAYPAGNDELGPDAPLDGRRLGADFANVDGWNMYHGEIVPGFPGHPHRGFETVTYVRNGLIDHSDSLGAIARFGRGDVQWLTAGRGIVHSEMFPLVDPDGPNDTELFQIWVNLPAADKMVDPYFTMLWDRDIPRLDHTDRDGRTATVTVIAGELASGEGEAERLAPPPPPPNSWASRPEADVAIWHIVLEPGASWEMPAAKDAETVRTLYVFDGDRVDIAGTSCRATTVESGHAAVVRADATVRLTGGDELVEILMLQGRPIGEPVAQHGPFVMNDRAGIEQAFRDYQRDQFGGWPFDREDPVRDREQGRFAIHADGRREDVEDSTPQQAGTGRR